MPRECQAPRECALLQSILHGVCQSCYVRTPALEAEIALLQAKAGAKPRHTRAPRRTWARGLSDAKRAKDGPTGTSAKPTA